MIQTTSNHRAQVQVSLRSVEETGADISLGYLLMGTNPSDLFIRAYSEESAEVAREKIESVIHDLIHRLTEAL